MLISILTTCFNSKELILNCIQSVKRLGDDVYEHIIIDDGSIDGTDDFINSLYDENIVYLKFAKIGRAKALNIGLREAKGDYICILDADDLLHAENINILLNLLFNDRSLQKSADVIYGNIRISNSNNLVIIPNNDIELKYTQTPKYKFYLYNPIPHVAVLLKRSILITVGGYSEYRNSQLDWDLWCKIISKNMKIYKIPLTLGTKYIHEKQSFEKSRHFQYVTSGVSLIFKHAVKSKNILYIIFALIFGTLRIIWGILPRIFRVKFWDFINKVNYYKN
jgi:teichuronic acid biosynthesis glycosyltransferase TuaG